MELNSIAVVTKMMPVIWAAFWFFAVLISIVLGIGIWTGDWAAFKYICELIRSAFHGKQ